jgi:flavin-dependent dehydrogenase
VEVNARSLPVVAVVGGGPAGAAAAQTLAHRGVAVTLIEASTYAEPRVGETLAPEARPLLQSLGFWPAMQGVDAVTSHGNASAWGSDTLETQSFVFSPHGPGWHLDRVQFDRALVTAAGAAGAQVWTGARVIRCRPAPAGGFVLGIRSTHPAGAAHPCDGMAVDAVIDATGRAARVARGLGAGRRRLDRLAAFSVRFAGGDGASRPSAQTLVEADAAGWWYSAPLPDDGMIAMRMTDPDLADGEGRDIDAWFARLARVPHTRGRCAGHAAVAGPRVDSAVSQRLVVPAARGSWLAVGDAAMATDPLSASGMLNALQTGRDGAHVLANHLAGAGDGLAAYEAELDSAFDAYCREWHAYYGIERRWSDAPFWLRRAPGVL